MSRLQKKDLKRLRLWENFLGFLLLISIIYILVTIKTPTRVVLISPFIIVSLYSFVFAYFGIVKRVTLPPKEALSGPYGGGIVLNLIFRGFGLQKPGTKKERLQFAYRFGWVSLLIGFLILGVTYVFYIS